MKSLHNLLVRSIALVLLCTLAAPGFAWAKPGQESIHKKLLSRGLGNWVAIEEVNGTLLSGRITRLEAQQFGMEISGYPETTLIDYSDVRRVRATDRGHKAPFILVGVTVGSAVAAGLIMHHEYENSKASMPTLPTMPTP